jgi:exosome complex component RRP43
MIQVGSISSAIGSATVKMNKTIVVCGIKAEIATPSPYSPNQGYIVPNFDQSPMVCPNIKPGPPDSKSQIISERIFQILNKYVLFSYFRLPLDKLIIVPGKVAWVLYLDLVCISDDGNLFDACITAVTESLKDCI